MKTDFFDSIRKEFKTLIHEVLDEREKSLPPKPVDYFTIHATAKLLGRSDRKIKQLVNTGVIRVTPDNRISSLEIDKLLNPAPHGQ
jgi:hypothetical protein